MPLSLLIHVPASLARAFTVMAGRHPLHRFVTPRGKAWTASNAQETLARLVEQLDLEHCLDGVQHLPLAKAAQEALEEAFANVIAEAESSTNARRFSGVTGRAARAAKTVDSVKTGKHAGADEEAES